MLSRTGSTKRSLCLVLSLCLGFVGGVVPVTRAQTETGLAKKERLEVFEHVWRAVSERYYDRTFHGIDWGAQHSAFRDLVQETHGRAEFYAALRHMLGLLGDAHTRVFAPEEGFDRNRPSGITVGVVVRPIEGAAVITWVEPGSDAARQGLRPGQRVQSINRSPVERALERARMEVGMSSTSLARELLSFEQLFYGPRDTTVELSVASEDGERRTVTLKRRFAEFPRRVITRRLPNDVGYIEVTGFGPEIEREFEAAVVSFMNSRGLILDLRNNGGGFVSTVARVASHFFTEETELGVFITRRGQPAPRRTQRLRAVYREPIVILVSARSASGAELLAASMQERHRALIVGTSATTCGCLVGVSRTLSLPDGGKLNVSDTDYRTAQGRRIEGAGVQPDERIDLRIADLVAGRDRVLEWSVDYLSHRVETHTGSRLSPARSNR